MSQEATIAVLENKLTNIDNNVSRIDDTMVKLGQIAGDLAKIIAVHEERLDRSENSEERIMNAINEVKEEIQKETKALAARIAALEKWRWILVGGGMVVGVLLGNVHAVGSVIKLLATG